VEAKGKKIKFFFPSVTIRKNSVPSRFLFFILLKRIRLLARGQRDSLVSQA